MDERVLPGPRELPRRRIPELDFELQLLRTADAGASQASTWSHNCATCPTNALPSFPRTEFFHEKHTHGPCVCLSQVMAESSWFNSLVIGCIVSAGILVGLNTYPKMSTGRVGQVVDGIDLFLQSTFTVDCVVKILREGRNPVNYW